MANEQQPLRPAQNPDGNPEPTNFDTFTDDELRSIMLEDEGTWNEVLARNTLEDREDCSRLIAEATYIINQNKDH